MGSQGSDQGYLAQVQLEVVVAVAAAAAVAVVAVVVDSLENGRGQGNHLPQHTLLNALMGTYA